MRSAESVVGGLVGYVGGYLLFKYLVARCTNEGFRVGEAFRRCETVTVLGGQFPSAHQTGLALGTLFALVALAGSFVIPMVSDARVGADAPGSDRE